MTYSDMARSIMWFAEQLKSRELKAIVVQYRVALRTYAEDGDAFTRSVLTEAEARLAGKYKEYHS